MGLFNFFRKKPRLSEEQNQLMDKLSEMQFGGKEQMRVQIRELYELLGRRYDMGKVANALTWMTMRFNREGDKSMQGLVDEGQLHRPDNAFTRDDVIKIYRYVAKKSFLKLVPNGTDEIFESMLQTLGNTDKGASTDVISGAYGEYGLCVTNPIPTRGIPSNEVYLRKLALLSGESFHWERIGSFGAPNIENPIDGYEIISDSGDTLCTIYISPYQRVISNTAPKGFYIKNDRPNMFVQHNDMNIGNRQASHDVKKVHFTKHLLLTSELLNENLLFQFYHRSNKSKYPTFLWSKCKIYCTRNEDMCYALPFLWFKYMAEHDSKKFEVAMEIINNEFGDIAHTNEDMVSDIRELCFPKFVANFDISKNRALLEKFWMDTISLYRYTNVFGDNPPLSIGENGDFRLIGELADDISKSDDLSQHIISDILITNKISMS